MTLRECRCPEPNPMNAPHKRHVCVNCRRNISTAWTSNDATIKAFLDRVAESFVVLPLGFEQFRHLAESRERAGRETFRHRHLGRDNIEEAFEELGDAANYIYFNVLQAARAGDGEADIDMALTVVHYIALAYAAALALRRKRAGSPEGLRQYDEHESAPAGGRRGAP